MALTNLVCKLWKRTETEHMASDGLLLPSASLNASSCQAPIWMASQSWKRAFHGSNTPNESHLPEKSMWLRQNHIQPGDKVLWSTHFNSSQKTLHNKGKNSISLSNQQWFETRKLNLIDQQRRVSLLTCLILSEIWFSLQKTTFQICLFARRWCSMSAVC